MRSGNKCIRILCIVPGFFVPTQVHVKYPLRKLAERGGMRFKILRPRDVTLIDLNGCNLVWLFRLVSPQYMWILHSARKMGKAIVYGTDDNFFDIPYERQARHYQNPFRIRALERYISLADRVIVYSRKMHEIASTFNNNVDRVGLGINPTKLKPHVAGVKGGPVRILYATSRHREDPLSKIFLPAITRLLEEEPGFAEIYFWGNIPDSLKGRKDVFFVPIMDYDRYLRKMNMENYDIGLAPLPDDDFHNSKTAIKYRDYSAFGIAGLYSDVPIYREVVDHERTGLLIRNNDEDDWYTAIKRLAQDIHLRVRIRNEAFKDCLDRFSLDDVADQLEKLFHRAMINVGSDDSKLRGFHQPRIILEDDHCCAKLMDTAREDYNFAATKGPYGFRSTFARMLPHVAIRYSGDSYYLSAPDWNKDSELAVVASFPDGDTKTEKIVAARMIEAAEDLYYSGFSGTDPLVNHPPGTLMIRAVWWVQYFAYARLKVSGRYLKAANRMVRLDRIERYIRKSVIRPLVSGVRKKQSP